MEGGLELLVRAAEALDIRRLQGMESASNEEVRCLNLKILMLEWITAALQNFPDDRPHRRRILCPTLSAPNGEQARHGGSCWLTDLVRSRF